MNPQNEIVRLFSLYLKSETVSPNTLRNYLADSRHFFNWLIKNYPNLASSNPNIIAQNISPDIFKKYKEFLQENQISSSTINRRLSSLRKLSAFFISQGWKENNPGKKVANINSKTAPDNSWQIVDSFAKSLVSEGKSQSTIRNYVSDIRGYLNFLSKSRDQFDIKKTN
jgi:site-specific recombinase XerD